MRNSFFSERTVFRKLPRILLANSRAEYTVGLISLLSIFWASPKQATTSLNETVPTIIRSMSLWPASWERATEP